MLYTNIGSADAQEFLNAANYDEMDLLLGGQVVASSDFLNTNAVQGGYIGAAFASGTNTTAPAAGTLDADHPGIVLIRSAGANSGLGYLTAANSFRLAGGERHIVIAKTPASMTNVRWMIGFMRTATASTPTHGVYHDVTGTALVGITTTASSPTTSDSIATLQADTWYAFLTELNADATAATFTLYDMAMAVVGTPRTNTLTIPTGSGNEVGAGASFFQTTAAADVVNLDRMRTSIPERVLVRGHRY